MVPSTATPIVAPTWRRALITADPAPPRSAVSVLKAALVAVGMARPKPMPASANQAATNPVPLARYSSRAATRRPELVRVPPSPKRTRCWQRPSSPCDFLGRRQTAGVSTSKVYAGDFPDPFVLKLPGSWLAFGTNSAGVNVQTLSSSDLVHWEKGADALPTLPSWAASGRTWSPSVLAVPAGYALYYSSRHEASGHQVLSVGVSANPAGPFVDRSSRALVDQVDLGGSIDPDSFLDGDGSAYLLWKADANAVGQPTSLWGAPLASDGTTLAGSPTRLLDQDARWEGPLIEAPAMIRHDDTYYLFYSAGWWNTADYAIGYAIGPSPIGPFRKQTVRGPWFASQGQVAGPGGQAFFSDGQHQLRMAYHGWDPGKVRYRDGGIRTLRIATITFAGDRPVAT
jgi:beta-xylosidase